MVSALAQKILPRAEVLRLHQAPRKSRLVFSNGVFDVLHRGHVEYLCYARTLGDTLVVGVNSDESTRRLKGPARPVNTQEDRAIVLAALECVDVVTIFDEDTPQALISALLPDVLVKGGDYRAQDVVGRAEVEAAGGQVIIVPLFEGRSTTSILQRIDALT
jgi:rfaE bifunctional protein nucleotidyltransferase chain/domain